MPIDAKQQFADVYKREHATTLKVLKAYPQDKADYRPHPGNNTAKQIVWTFVVENNCGIREIREGLHGGGAVVHVHPPGRGKGAFDLRTERRRALALT